MAISRVQDQAEARRINAEMEKLRQRAARQAMRSMNDDQTVPMVEVTVLPAGDGRISMGEHFAAIGDAHYEEGEKFSLQQPIAIALYDKGYVNFEGAKQASADAREARLAAIRARRDAERRAREEIMDDE